MWQIWPLQSGVKQESFRKSCSQREKRMSVSALFRSSYKWVTSVHLTLSFLSENKSVLSFFQQLIWNSTLQLWQHVSWMKPCKHRYSDSRCRFSSFLNNHDAHLKVWIAEVDLDGVSEAVLMPTHRVCFRRKLTHFYKLLQMFLQNRESSDQHLKHHHLVIDVLLRSGLKSSTLGLE